MNEFELIQGSPEWRAARVGSLGASQLHDAIARTKSGWGASRANVMTQLIIERLTGDPVETFTNAAMLHGLETEPHARAAYAFMRDADVVEVGLVRHPTIIRSHASSDGLVGEDGLLEIKCPSSTTHLDTLLGQEIPAKYLTQMNWQMACTGRAWCDFVSFDPRLPEHMRLFVRRVHRDDVQIVALENEARGFLAEMDAKLGRLAEVCARAA